MFNVMLAAHVRCRSAMIRVDYILFTTGKVGNNGDMRPSIASKLLTVRAEKNECTSVSHVLPHLVLRYMVSEGGKEFWDPIGEPEKLTNLLRRADFA